MRSRPLRGCLAALLTVLVAGVAPAGAQTPPPETVLDHFRCYSAVTFGDPTGPLELSDQFGTSTLPSLSSFQLCNPVRKSAVGGPPAAPLLNPDAHLVCYTGDRPDLDRVVRVTNQFGVDTLQVHETFTLCAPASKAVQPGTPAPLGDIEQRLDHFRCYIATGTRAPPPVVLQDQFATQVVSPLAAFLLCNPVEKRRAGFPVTPARRPFAHLVCYSFSTTSPATAPDAVARTQFGTAQFFSPSTDSGFLCVPSLKEVVVPRVAQHFRAYEAVGGPASRERVTFVDQFGTERVRMGPARLLMTPVEKRRGGSVEPIERPAEHLKCYAVSGPAANRTVTISNQFSNATVVTVGRPRHRCTPAAKALAGDPGAPPADLNHYKCYSVTPQASMGEAVGLTDQFGSANVRVQRLRRLCNPVEKRRDGRAPEPPPHPTEHLACYQLSEPRGFQPRSVFTRDQFGDETLGVSTPSLLCVPSEKTEGGGDT